MWRALFLAVGFFAMILGIECLGVERFTLKIHDDPPESLSILPLDSKPTEGPPKQLVPPPWAPWSLLSSGAVMCLYSFTIPRRVAGG
jgi:hypothetical protein